MLTLLALLIANPARPKKLVPMEFLVDSDSSAIRTYNETFIVKGAWLTPNLVLPARFAKLTAQVDF